MIRKNRRLLSILAAGLLLLSLVLTGCGTASPEESSTESRTEETAFSPETPPETKAPGEAEDTSPAPGTLEPESSGGTEESGLKEESETEPSSPETSPVYSGDSVPGSELPVPKNLWHSTEDRSFDTRTDPLLSFSPASGLYSKDITVHITLSEKLPKDAEIYYTLDGSDPSENSEKYDPEKGIPFEVHTTLLIHSIKAFAVFDTYETYIFEQTYVLLRHPSDLPGIDIVCVTSDPENLYNHETGIMIPGAVYDEEIESGKPKRALTPLGNQGQRGDEWIRNGHVAIFSPDGTLQLEQGIGLAVSGGTSVKNTEKSLKLIAGNEYDDVDKLLLPLVNEAITESDASFISRNNSIRLHSESQVSKYGNIRSSLMSRLATESGFTGVSPTRRCVVFLNNAYYGILEYQQNYSDSFIAHHYGLSGKDEIAKIKGSENFTEESLVVSPPALMKQDLDIPENREALEQVVDMDSFLLYYALNILACNTDWPQNNYELWCYDGEEIPGNPYSDGRYRYLIYDVDMTWITPSVEDFFEGLHGDTFAQIMTGTARAYNNQFRIVMESDYYRDKFLTLLRDLLNTSFTEENLLRIINEEAEKVRKANSIWLTTDQQDTRELFIEGIRSKARNLRDRMEVLMEEYFELPLSYSFTAQFSCTEGASLRWNNMEIPSGGHYENRYYRGCDFLVTAEAAPGYVLDGFTVNGVPAEGPVLNVRSGVLMEGQNTLVIEVIAHREEGPLPVIDAVSSALTNDRVRIRNAGTEDAALGGLILSDRAESDRYILPDITLAPGESIVFYGPECPDREEAYTFPFSISDEETVYLKAGSTVLDSVFVPKLDPCEYYGRTEGQHFKYILFEE